MANLLGIIGGVFAVVAVAGLVLYLAVLSMGRWE